LSFVICLVLEIWDFVILLGNQIRFFSARVIKARTCLQLP